MKKQIISVFILLLVMISPLSVRAKTCDNETKQSILKKANAIDIKYELVNESSLSEEDKENNRRFKIIISNIPKNIVVEENGLYKQYKNDTNDIVTTKESSSWTEGLSYTFYFYYEGDECDIYLIKTKNIKLPYYNQYWNNEICKGIENFTYCQKLTNVKIDYDSLKNKIEKYKDKNQTNKDNTMETNESKSIFFNDKILLYSIPLLIVLVVIIIIIFKKRKRRKLI